MKTNMDYLREFIKGNDEAIEFWNAVNDEIKKEKESKERLKEVLTENIRQRSSGSNGYLQVIDCGIGEIRYRTSNLQLQSIMEGVKEKLEHEAKFGVLPESANALFS